MRKIVLDWVAFTLNFTYQEKKAKKDKKKGHE